ncbi:MAG: nicotinic acid mononucleotide adenylyltransferase [Firmicutes bacterium HGW-Firmicutes-13]|nr:MAG: nicotinic acid mononucleotide adenylyltransferase [Firmicutes bacterium HGW-Firmicutes-13]
MGKKKTGTKRNIGIMGGTFDPIHLGHLLGAEEARETYDLDEVIFVPAGYPPHKKEELLSHAEHRYMMTVLATITNPYFKVSRIELDISTHSYTYTLDTVTWFKKILGSEKELYFITGADAVLDIVTWKGFDRLLKICKFIAVTRPGYSLSRLEETLGSVYADLLDRILILTIPGVAISSTEIRKRVQEGKTIKYLTTSGVEKYILKNKLYIKF